MGFIFENIRILDFIDILLVAFLLYQVYLLIRGTVALNIFYGVFILYLIGLLVRALNMQLLGSILGQFIGLGLIALLIVFQQEVRRFLLILGTRYFRNTQWLTFNNFFRFKSHGEPFWDFNLILDTCYALGAQKTGALIVLAQKSELRAFAETGQLIDGVLSKDLILSIFQRTTPLHDGAVILVKNKIKAAGCVLPITENQKLRGSLGMRHRAAVGMSEDSDSIVLVVSEESGFVSLAINGELIENHRKEYLMKKMKAVFKETEA